VRQFHRNSKSHQPAEKKPSIIQPNFMFKIMRDRLNQNRKNINKEIINFTCFLSSSMSRFFADISFIGCHIYTAIRLKKKHIG
jgi:hypothetical protein